MWRRTVAVCKILVWKIKRRQENNSGWQITHNKMDLREITSVSVIWIFVVSDWLTGWLPVCPAACVNKRPTDWMNDRLTDTRICICQLTFPGAVSNMTDISAHVRRHKTCLFTYSIATLGVTMTVLGACTYLVSCLDRLKQPEEGRPCRRYPFALLISTTSGH